ncbi:MAG: hypothetical protein AB7R89_10755 [Dehalococcoidia bacterium]
MRPSGLELLRGVRSLLLTEVLPEIAAPHLRSQVMIAVGMLDSAAKELDDGPAAFGEERARMMLLATEALPVVRRLSQDASLVRELEDVTAASVEPPARRVSALNEEAARFLGILDRLSEFVDRHSDAGDAEAGALGRQVDDELRAIIARRATWIGGSG